MQGVTAQVWVMQVTLLKLLTAYEAVLEREGLSATNDIRLYSFLLQLSLGSESDWSTRFEMLQSRCVLSDC